MKHLLLFSLVASFSTAAFSADAINNSPASFNNSTANNPATTIPLEYVNSCKGLSEKDTCQVHGKTNNLVSGSCKTKAISANNFDLVCVPDPVKSPATDSDAPLAPDHEHQKKRKH